MPITYTHKNDGLAYLYSTVKLMAIYLVKKSCIANHLVTILQKHAGSSLDLRNFDSGCREVGIVENREFRYYFFRFYIFQSRLNTGDPGVIKSSPENTQRRALQLVHGIRQAYGGLRRR